jgi:hypothetical protein
MKKLGPAVLTFFLITAVIFTGYAKKETPAAADPNVTVSLTVWCWEPGSGVGVAENPRSGVGARGSSVKKGLF